MPIARESFCERPQPGMMPTRACVSAKRASLDAISTSQASASSKPPVIATPLIAPMIGPREARDRLHHVGLLARRRRADRALRRGRAPSGRGRHRTRAGAGEDHDAHVRVERRACVKRLDERARAARATARSSPPDDSASPWRCRESRSTSSTGSDMRHSWGTTSSHDSLARRRETNRGAPSDGLRRRRCPRSAASRRACSTAGGWRSARA